MEQKYSTDLMVKARAVFEKRVGHALSDELVGEYLDQALTFAHILLRWERRNRIDGNDITDAA